MRLLALAALLLLLAPVAAAEHDFSHWVHVEGRVVDARGLPVPGARPEVTVEGVSGLGPCLEAESPVTDPTGDFAVCRHGHDVAADAAATVRLGNATARVPLDPLTRSATVLLRLDEPSGARDLSGERRFLRTWRVEGRAFTLWDGGDADGVQVAARPMADFPVRVRILADDGLLAERNATTDRWGAYAVDLDVTDVPAGARVEAATAGATAQARVDPAFRRTDVDLVRDPVLVPLFEPPPGGAPGRVPLPGLPWLLLGLGLTAAARRAARGGGG